MDPGPSSTRAAAIGTSLVRTRDLDEAVTRVNGLMSNHSVTPGSGGDLDARIDGFTVAGLSVLEMDYGVPLRVRADPLTDYLAVCVPLDSSMGVVHNGRRFEAEAGGTAFVGTPESELIMDWRLGLRLLVIRVDLAPLRHLSARMVGDRSLIGERLRFETEMGATVVTQALVAQVRLLDQLLVGADGATLSPLVVAQAREQVMTALLLGQQHSWSEALRQRPSRARATAVREAQELLRARSGDPVTIAEVAEVVGVSERALHAAFRRELDESPKQFLQRVRLENAHRDLVATPPGSGVRVVDIAHRWGFGNAGRFAAQYRQRFGELPGDTLAR